MRSFVFVTVAAALWLLSGCGGGGGGGSTGGTFTIASGQYIEFLRSGGGWFDPFNLVVGDSGTAVLANYDSLGNRTVLFSSNWGTTAGGGFISFNSSTGAFSVVSAPAGEFRFQTTANIAGTPTLFEQRGRVPSAAPSISGRVTEMNPFTGFPGNTGVPHLNVDFFDGGGNLVGSARTMSDGRFTSRVPTTAMTMMIEAASIKTSRYYRSIYYLGDTYSPFDTGCRITVGPIGGGSNPLPASAGLPLASGVPPPPPTGCT